MLSSERVARAIIQIASLPPDVVVKEAQVYQLGQQKAPTSRPTLGPSAKKVSKRRERRVGVGLFGSTSACACCWRKVQGWPRLG